jgi:hypothetical protein
MKQYRLRNFIVIVTLVVMIVVVGMKKSFVPVLGFQWLTPITMRMLRRQSSSAPSIIVSIQLRHTSDPYILSQCYPRLDRELSGCINVNDEWDETNTTTIPISLPVMVSSYQRRILLGYPSVVATVISTTQALNANAAGMSSFFRPSSQQSQSLYALAPQRNTTTLRTQQSLDTQLFPNGVSTISADPELTVELCLLRLLPVKNKFFRKLQGTLESLTPILRSSNEGDNKTTVSMNWTGNVRY